MSASTLKTPTVYLGQVATRASITQQITTAHTFANSRSMHVMRENVSSFQIVIYNGYIDNYGEHPSGQTFTFTASVEYPVGTCTRITFSGLNSVALASGAVIVSDPVSYTGPIGSQFYIREYQTSATSIMYSQRNADYFDQYDITTSSDLTGTCGALNTATVANLAFNPQAIIGKTSRPSLYIAGDSRNYGGTENGPPDLGNDYGEVAHIFGPQYAYINMGVNSATAQQEATQNIVRQQFMKYCSHAVNALGINDVTASRTSAQIVADRNTLDAIMASKVQSGVVIGTTLSPHTTSTDGFITTANQTVVANESVRQAFNTNVRNANGGLTYEHYLLDFDGAIDPAASGKWPVGTYPGLTAGTATTADGLHATQNSSIQFYRQYVPANQQQLKW